MEASPPRHNNQRDKDRRANNHMQCVHASHGKVKAVEDFHILGIADWFVPLKAETGNVVMMKLLAVLNHFNAEKNKAKKESGNKVPDKASLFTVLGRINGHRHREATQNQHSGIKPTKLDVENITPSDEGVWVVGAIHRIACEQPAKEKDLMDKERPHAERNRLGLLRPIVELMGYKGIVMRRANVCLLGQRWPPEDENIRMLLRS